MAHGPPLTATSGNVYGPWVTLVLLATGAVHALGTWRRSIAVGLSLRALLRAGAFYVALALLWLALAGPLDARASESFAAHMAQHMVLLVLAPPLLVFARPANAGLRASPRTWSQAQGLWRRLAAISKWSPLHSIGTTAALHALVLWAWHLPTAFELALAYEAVHWLEHATLLAAGSLYWRATLRAPSSRVGWALASMWITLLHTGALGALLTLAPRPLYPIYADRLGTDLALTDQQLAGLIMWVPMGAVYLFAGIALARRALANGFFRANAA